MKKFCSVIAGFVVCAFLSVSFNAGVQGRTLGESHLGVLVEDGLLEGVWIETARFANPISMAEFDQQAKDFRYLVLVGKSDEPHIAALLKEHRVALDRHWLGEQGYQVVVLERKEGKYILVTAATETGVLYGVIGLRLRLEKTGLDSIIQWNTSYRDRPVFAYRGGNGRFRGNWQWNSVMRESHSGTTPLRNIYRYEKFPEVFPDEQFKEKYLKLVEETEKYLVKELAEAKKYGVKVYYFTYQPTLAKWAREGFYKAHPEAKPVSTTPTYKQLCPSAEISKKLTYDKWHSLFQRFPASAGVIITISAADSGGLYCDCDKCRKYPIHQRVIDYVMIIRKAIQSVNPKAVVVVRSWDLPTDMVKLAKDLPDDVYYASKLTCPPGDDYLWTDAFCSYLEGGLLPRFIAIGTCAWHTDDGTTPFLCYTGPKQKERFVKMAQKGSIGASCGPCAPYGDYTNPEDILMLPSRAARIDCGWDPFAFDPDAYLRSWAVKRFGTGAGQHVYRAFKDTKLIADSFILNPKRTNIYHMYAYRGCGGGGYGGSCKLPEELATATAKDINRFKKIFEIPRSIKIGLNAAREMAKAARLAPDNKDIRIYLTMARETVHLTRLWQNYHLSLLYKCVAANTTSKAQAAGYNAQARSYALKAYKQLPGYLEHYLKIYPHLVNGDYYWKQPGLYNSFITQQTNNAYHQAVMRHKQEKMFPLVLSRLVTKPVETGSADTSTYMVDINQQGVFAPKMLRRDGLKTMELHFKGDLSRGAMLCFIYRPHNDPTKQNRWYGAGAYLDIFLDGRKVATVTDFMTFYSRYNLLRYVKLPASSEPSHKLKISLVDGKGAQFQRLYICGPAGSELITPLAAVVPFAEDFSRPVKWKVAAEEGALSSAKYDAKMQAMEVAMHGQAAGVVYMDLPQSYGPHLVFECDLQWKEAPAYSQGYFKLFGGDDPGQWKLRPVYGPGRDKRYGPRREGHYGFYMYGQGKTLKVKPFVIGGGKDISERDMVPSRAAFKKEHTKLKVGEKYHLKIARFAERAHFTITDSRGVIVMDEPLSLTLIQDFMIDKIGFQNHPDHEAKPPIIVRIDNINFRQYREAEILNL